MATVSSNVPISDNEWLTQEMDTELILLNAEELVRHEKDGQRLFIDPLRARWWRTSAEGEYIMGLCRNGTTPRQIIRGLSEQFNLDEDIIGHEVQGWLRKAVERGYLARRGDTRMRQPPAEPSPRLLMLWWEITHRCQLQCPFCYVGRVKPDTPTELSLAEYQRLLEDPVVHSAARIIVSGGEPTLRDDLVEIVKAIKQAGPKITLISNGICQDFALWEQLVEIVDAIQISMEGPTAEVHDALRGRGSFEKTRAVAEFLGKTKLKDLYIAVTPSNANVERLTEMLYLAYDLGASLLHISPLQRGPLAKENDIELDFAKLGKALADVKGNYLRLESWVKGTGESARQRPFEYLPYPDQSMRVVLGRYYLSCGLGRRSAGIGPYGDVSPCIHLRDAATIRGNVRQRPFADLYNEMLDVEKALAVDTLASCRGCEFRHMCGGGCRAAAYHACGDLAGPDPNCQFIREQIYHHMWSLDL